MGFLKSKSASLTINDSTGLNWLELNKGKAIEGEQELMGSSVHLVTRHLITLWLLLSHTVRELERQV